MLLDFIADEILFEETRKLLLIYKNAKNEKDIHKNVIDPFSAIFQAMSDNQSYEQWLKIEKERQSQKTLQNGIGYFHQNILGNIPGWEVLPKGKDVLNQERKIIAEIKNKYNTTKYDYHPTLYDKLEKGINGKYKGYTAYYVEIIPENPGGYERPFVPSDADKEKKDPQKKRPKNPNILRIDGYTFYSIATGNQNALKDLFVAIPKVISEILIEDTNLSIGNEDSATFYNIFDICYFSGNPNKNTKPKKNAKLKKRPMQ